MDVDDVAAENLREIAGKTPEEVARGMPDAFEDPEDAMYVISPVPSPVLSRKVTNTPLLQFLCLRLPQRVERAEDPAKDVIPAPAKKKKRRKKAANPNEAKINSFRSKMSNDLVTPGMVTECIT